MLFAAIYIPDFAVGAIVRSTPALRAWAVAVVEGAAPMQQVTAVNDLARAAGVEVGMTELQARGRIGSIEIRRRAPLAEAAASAALFDCASAVSPRVEMASPELALADITGLERLFGPPAQVAQEILRRLRDVELEANIGVSANLDAAIHAARGFSGVTVIPPRCEAERLGALPVDVLLSDDAFERAGQSEVVRTERHPWASRAQIKNQKSKVEILETLDRWGVRTFRALAALPEVAVAERLGQQGIALRKLARGEGARELSPTEEAATFEEAIGLEYPVCDMEALAFLVNRLVDQLCVRLTARALATNELRMRLELEDIPDIDCSRESVNDTWYQGTGNRDQEKASVVGGRLSLTGQTPIAKGQTDTKVESPKTYTIKLPVPMLDARVFLKLIQLELRAAPPPAPVEKIFVSAEPVRPRFAQGGLFLPVAPEPERLELTLARIASVVSGETATAQVGAAEVLDTHRPDAFAVRRFVGEQGTGDRAEHAACSAGVSPAVARASRPQAETPAVESTNALRIFRPPLAAEVATRDGRPLSVHCASGIEGDIVWAAGPWRASGDWWREDAFSRETFDVALKAGETLSVYRVFCDTMSNRWFVEGSYD